MSGGERVEVPLRPRMLRVVAENLVANAIRYAGPGATCRVTIGDAGAGAVLAVADDGAGVSAGELDAPLRALLPHRHGALDARTGLGLAIVKHIVTSAGGSVEATRRPGGRGVEIVCRFPSG